MCRLIVLLVTILALISCSLVVKPTYIEPETDLSFQLERDFKQLKSKSTQQLVSQILNEAYVYHKRIDEKLLDNNTRAFSS